MWQQSSDRFHSAPSPQLAGGNRGQRSLAGEGGGTLSYMCTCTLHVHVHVCTCMYVNVCMYMYVHCMYMYVHVHACTCMYMYVCTCIYMYMYINLCTVRLRQEPTFYFPNIEYYYKVTNVLRDDIPISHISAVSNIWETKLYNIQLVCMQTAFLYYLRCPSSRMNTYKARQTEVLKAVS